MQPAASIVISKRRGVCEWQNFSGSLPNPLLTNASKVPCRQVGVNSSSSWQGTLPTRGLDNIKESPLPSPETKQVSIHFSGLRNKNRLASHLFFSLFFFFDCAPFVCLHRCMLFPLFNHRVHVTRQIEGRQLPCNLQSVYLWDRPLQRADGLV